MTKWNIMNALTAPLGKNRVEVRSTAHDRVVIGLLLAVEREDGSGNNFNLRILEDNGERTNVYVNAVN